MNRVNQGVVIEKLTALNLVDNETLYLLRLRCGDDEHVLMVDQEMYGRAWIEGLGSDTIVEFGTVLRIVRGGDPDVVDPDATA